MHTMLLHLAALVAVLPAGYYTGSHTYKIPSDQNDRDNVLVLLSVFEDDCLIPDIRAGEYVYLHGCPPHTPRGRNDFIGRFQTRSFSVHCHAPSWAQITWLNVFDGWFSESTDRISGCVVCLAYLECTRASLVQGRPASRARALPPSHCQVHCTASSSMQVFLCVYTRLRMDVWTPNGVLLPYLKLPSRQRLERRSPLQYVVRFQLFFSRFARLLWLRKCSSFTANATGLKMEHGSASLKAPIRPAFVLHIIAHSLDTLRVCRPQTFLAF